MKKLATNYYPQIHVLTVAACAVLTVGLASTSAQQVTYMPDASVNAGDHTGFYLGGDLGPSFMPDFQSSRFGFPGRFSAQPGYRLGVEPGYNFLATHGLTLGGEFETGVIYNHLNSVSGPGAPGPLRGDYDQVPLLGNLVLKFHPNDFITPYIGVGGGGDVSVARIHTPGVYGYEHDSQIDPAVQGMAGVRFRLNSFSDVGFGYKFLAAFPYEGSAVETHSAEASFTLTF